MKNLSVSMESDFLHSMEISFWRFISKNYSSNKCLFRMQNIENDDMIYVCSQSIWRTETLKITEEKINSIWKMENSKWVRFEEIPDAKRKTKIFEIKTKDSNILLGQIKWFASWRCYAFYPAADTVFELTCLQDITKFITNLALQRKVKSQKV